MDQFQIQQQFNQAIQIFESGNTEMAEHLLRPLYVQLPEHPLITNAFAVALVKNSRADEAISVLKKVLKKKANQADLLGTLAAAFEAKEDLNEAEKQIDKAIKVEPKQPKYYFNRGDIRLKKKERKEALKDFKKCLSLQKDFLPAHINMGLIHHQDGDLEQAEISYAEVLKIDSKNVYATINLGHCKVDAGKVVEAISYYQKAISFNEKDEVAWLALGKVYLDQNRLEEAIDLVAKAIDKCKDSAQVLLLAGNVYQTKGDLTLAEQYFERSLAINPDLEGANRNLRRLLNKKIPGWHFTMLADEERNQAYQNALGKVVSSTSTVLDIGTGSGILSMMAARAGASNIYACELHTELAKSAEVIIKQNGFEEQIQVFNLKSTELEKEKLNKADILVSEILDAGVVGEGVLPSIRHAVANLCAAGVKIIPAKAKLYAQVIEIPSRSKLAPIGKISGFDLSYFDRFRIPDEYTTIHLLHEEHRVLSEEFFLHEYDFYNIPPAIHDNTPNSKMLEVSVSASGSLQAVVFWFDLYLDDEIMVSSRPGGELLHWGQALYCFSNPIDVEEGETVNLEMLHSDQLIRFEHKKR